MIQQIFKGLNVLTRTYRLRRAPIAYARSIGVRIGDDCHLHRLETATFGSEPFLITLGNNVTVTDGVRFITHDGAVCLFRDKHPDIDLVSPIVVGSNVFIGINAIIMPGVTIGDNCIIGSGAVVTNNIPSGNVAAGVPARCIKTIDQYWEKVISTAVYSRSMDKEQKRIFLLEKYVITNS